MTSRVKMLVGAGLSCLVVTVLTYLLLVPPGLAFFWLSLAALALAELMLFGGLALVIGAKRGKASSAWIAAGGTSLACACSVALFVLGLLFISASLSMLGVFLSLGLAILLLYGMGLTVLLFVGKSIQARESGEMQVVRASLARADMVKEAAGCCADAALRDRLLVLSEDVRYDGGSADSATDEGIKALHGALEAGDIATAEELADRLFRLERRRKEKTALDRRGGF